MFISSCSVCGNSIQYTDDDFFTSQGWRKKLDQNYLMVYCPNCGSVEEEAKENNMGYYGGEVPTAITGATTKLTPADQEPELFMMRVHFHTPSDEDTYDEYDVTEETYLQVADSVAKGMGITFQYFVADSDPREPAYFACASNVIKYID